MSTSLRDIVVFWKDHVDYLSTISSKGARFQPMNPGPENSAQTWTRYQSVLLAAISSISASSDAVLVNAVGAPCSSHQRLLTFSQSDTPQQHAEQSPTPHTPQRSQTFPLLPTPQRELSKKSLTAATIWGKFRGFLGRILGNPKAAVNL